MAGIKDDTEAQWILLSGLTISISLIAVAVFINQAAITGYHSANAVFDFPKDEIRELVAQTRETTTTSAQIAWELNHASNESVLHNFTRLFHSYTAQLATLYAAQGSTVNITLSKAVFNSTHHIDTVWLNISYNDGTTSYASQPEIIEVRQ